jgi:hypothetical protein
MKKCELRHVRQQRFLAHESRGPCAHVEHANAGNPVDDVRQILGVPAREDVDRVAELGEVSRRMRDVDILAARVDAAGNGERRRMLADHRDIGCRRVHGWWLKESPRCASFACFAGVFCKARAVSVEVPARSGERASRVATPPR